MIYKQTTYLITYEDHDGDIHEVFVSAPNPVDAYDRIASGLTVRRIVTMDRAR